MATKTALRKVAAAITGLTSAVSNTFVESAHDIAEACQQAFGGSIEFEADDILSIQNSVEEQSAWKGSSSAGARRSEVKSIVGAYPWIEPAARAFKREYGELRREHFVKLARMCPEYETPTDAALDCVSFFEERGENNGGTKTPAEKLASGFTMAINNAPSDLKQSLYRLARKHNVAVK